MSKARGKIISFEGIECCGKGTQIKLVERWLNEQKIRCVSDHEPGGTLYGEALRAILKNPELALPAIFEAVKNHSDYPAIKDFHLAEKTDYSRSGQVEMFLYLAARAAFAEKIQPLIDDGYNILADRLMDSTTAYQGYGRLLGNKQSLIMINMNNQLALSGIWPDLTFFLDIPVDVMYERMKSQSAEKNSFFETKYDHGFYERVRDGYFKIALDNPDRVKIIDGMQSIEEVFDAIKKILNKVL